MKVFEKRCALGRVVEIGVDFFAVGRVVDDPLEQALHSQGHLLAKGIPHLLLVLAAQPNHFFEHGGGRFPCVGSQQSPDEAPGFTRPGYVSG